MTAYRMPRFHPALPVALVLFWIASSCAGDGVEPEAEDGGGPRGYSGPSLCTSERDAHPFCNSDEGQVGSLRALELARELVPDEPLIDATSDLPGLSMNLDGLDSLWGFGFEERATGDLVSVAISADGSNRVDRLEDREPCGEDAEIALLDSEAIVPDAVLRFEARMGRPFTGRLAMMQHGCAQERPELHSVLLREYTGEEQNELSDYYARYWDDGRFIELIGPCPYEIARCLEGVVP